MRNSVLFLALACGASASAHDSDIPLNTGAELLEWCRVESEAQFVAEGKSPRNWTARHVEQGNRLQVEGSWRVDGVRHAIVCRVARGARSEHATLTVSAVP